MKSAYIGISAAILAVAVLTSGCIFVYTEEKRTGDGSGDGTGFMELYVSDAPADIDDFDHLYVTFEKVRIAGYYGDDSQESWREESTSEMVDLTTLVGPRAERILNLSLEEGDYTKIELYVESTQGIVDGKETDIFVPSGKLMINGGFRIENDETVKFVFDINIVKRGNQDAYNLIPVIAKSGVVGEDLSEDEFEEV
jgi:hypothetical protein